MRPAAIARYLASLDPPLVTFDADGADCFLADLPDQPVDACGIWSTPAPADLMPYGHVGAQVIVRRDDSGGHARGGYEAALAILQALHGLRNTTMAQGTDDELKVIWCMATSEEPLSLGPDKNQLLRWSVTFDLFVQLGTTNRFDA